MLINLTKIFSMNINFTAQEIASYQATANAIENHHELDSCTSIVLA